jgi:hypothetical protein
VRVLLIVGLVACGFHHGASQGNGSQGDAPIPHDGPLDARPLDGPPDAPPDAGRPKCNISTCIGAGGGCDLNGICVIPVITAGPVKCPAGLTCEIGCNSMAACRNGIDCSAAAGCTIYCAAQNSCQGTAFACDHGCTLYCIADNTCDNSAFTCGTGAQACDLECCGDSTCGGNSSANGLSENQPGTCP